MTPENPETPVPPMSEVGRFAAVLTDPKRAYRDIVTRPRWWFPLGLVIVLALVFNTVYERRIGWERFMTQTFETNPRTQNLPAEQRARAIEQASRFASYAAYGGAIVGTPAFAALEAAVLLLLFNVALGAQLKFQTVFGVVTYSWIPAAISSSLAILVMFLKNPDDFNLQNPLAFNLGAFLDPQSTAKWVLSLCTSLDLFSLWIVLLLAVGLASAARRITFGKSLAAVASLWVVMILLKSAWAGIFG
ncbi:MAG TPA: YIP1 family protein [Bryobacteraceae bacterium]|nr:YIP1 family protein [Bryobacteraceae bacterium]